MTTRIYHRIDTAANWSTAAGNSFGKLAKGELGIVTSTAGSVSRVTGYFGIDATPTVYSSCPVVFNAYVDATVAASPVVSEPVAYTKPATTPPNGSVVSWDADSSSWVVDTEVLSLDAYPTADGTVVWNHSLGKFQVGTAVSAVELDGGEYTV